VEERKIRDDTPEETSSVSAGVEELIERLREQGVERGRAQAAALVDEASREAKRLLGDAGEQARGIVEQARREAGRLESSGKEALRIAARDAILEMKNVLIQRFVRDVERLVARELRDDTFLKRCILEVVARTRDSMLTDPGERLEVLLPRDAIGIDQLRRKPEELETGTLSQFTLTVADDILREGVTFRPNPDDAAGIRVRLVDRHVDIDLTDRAIAAFLLQHLEPRFRAMLEGIVR
jgi:V/A-type H+-transporting ATPase subunit E